MREISQPPSQPSSFSLEPIGVVHSCYPEKFGIPRQPGLVRGSSGRLELLPPCNREEMVRGLEAYSHIWIHFLFHETMAEGWRPTVRPPWLGGQKRVGVFASRSPHRPNFIGLSVVRLTGISVENDGIFLEISGLDLVDKTPVVDIKPYLPYSDSLPEAKNGLIPAPHSETSEVIFTEAAAEMCTLYEQRTGRQLRLLITETLAQDPRPASQRRQTRQFGIGFWDVNVRFEAQGQRFLVLSIANAEDRERIKDDRSW